MANIVFISRNVTSDSGITLLMLVLERKGPFRQSKVQIGPFHLFFGTMGIALLPLRVMRMAKYYALIEGVYITVRDTREIMLSPILI